MTEPLSPSQVEELRRQLASVRGPWMLGTIDRSNVVDSDGWGMAECASTDIAELIVAMRNSLGALLKERERDKARIVEMGDALTKIRHAGALLANCAYNLHQQDGIGVRAKQSLKVSFEGWDAVAHLGRSSATLPDALATGAPSLSPAGTTADARPTVVDSATVHHAAQEHE